MRNDFSYAELLNVNYKCQLYGLQLFLQTWFDILRNLPHNQHLFMHKMSGTNESIHFTLQRPPKQTHVYTFPQCICLHGQNFLYIEH